MLSLELVETPVGIFVIAGVAAGDLIVIDLTSAIAEFEAGRDFAIPAEAYSLFSAVHIMGINDLKVLVDGEEMRCFTVGDDQSLNMTCLQKKGQKVELVQSAKKSLISGTSLRGVSLVDHSVFVTGWEQKVQRWNWKDGKLEKAGELNVQAPETGSVSCIYNGHSIYGSVCGDMGFEVFECVV